MFNNSEGGRISSIVLQKLSFFFFQNEYIPVFANISLRLRDFATTRTLGSECCNLRSKRRREVCFGVLERISPNPIMSNKMWERPKMSN